MIRRLSALLLAALIAGVAQAHFVFVLPSKDATTAEIVMPLTLLFSPWPWLTWIAIVSMWMLHAFIISTIPLAVPLEWNVFFAFCAAFLFANFHAGSGYGVGDMNPALLAGVTITATWVLGTGYGFHLIRRAQRSGGACPVPSP